MFCHATFDFTDVCYFVGFCFPMWRFTSQTFVLWQFFSKVSYVRVIWSKLLLGLSCIWRPDMDFSIVTFVKNSFFRPQNGVKKAYEKLASQHAFPVPGHVVVKTSANILWFFPASRYEKHIDLKMRCKMFWSPPNCFFFFGGSKRFVRFFFAAWCWTSRMLEVLVGCQSICYLVENAGSVRDVAFYRLLNIPYDLLDTFETWSSTLFLLLGEQIRFLHTTLLEL